MTLDIETRSAELEYREDAGTGYLEGIAVPYGAEAVVRRADGTSFRERWDFGAAEPEGTVWLYDEHGSPVGVVEESEQRAEGWWIRARLAVSDLALEVRRKLLAGARHALSVGFVPLTIRSEGGVRVVARGRVREVSTTSTPVYPLALITHVRHNPEGTETMTGTATVTPPPAAAVVTPPPATDPTPSAEVAELRSQLDLLTRQVAINAAAAPVAVVPDTRSAAEVLKAIAAGDADTIAMVNEVQTRAYTGSTTADGGNSLKPGYVGDITRIIDNASGVLISVLSTGVLPDTGMQLEFTELDTDSSKVEKQANQGDDLAFGKVTLKNRTTPVDTYGGYSSLTRQAIERSTLPVLQRTLEGQAIAAGKALKAAARAAFAALAADRLANGTPIVLGATLAASTYENFVRIAIRGSVRFSQNALSLENLITSPDVFEKLSLLKANDGRPLMSLDGSGDNTIGSMDVTGLRGNLITIPVVMDPDATGESAAFIDSRALRVYAGAATQLQDENIVNLSKTFSTYRYAAFAPEIPGGLVPVKLTA